MIDDGNFHSIIIIGIGMCVNNRETIVKNQNIALELINSSSMRVYVKCDFRILYHINESGGNLPCQFGEAVDSMNRDCYRGRATPFVKSVVGL